MVYDENVSAELLDDNDSNGNVSGGTYISGRVVCIYPHIGKRAPVKLEQERMRLCQIFPIRFFSSIIIKTDVLQLTQNATNLLGIGGSSIGNPRNFSGGLIHPDDAGTLWRPLRQSAGTAGAMLRRNALLGRDGGWIWCECKMSQLTATRDIVIGKVIDISGRKARR